MASNFCNQKILLFIFLCICGFCKATDSQPKNNNIFRPSYIGIPRHYMDGLMAKDAAINEMKRALSLGRSEFRPGKRSADINDYQILELSPGIDEDHKFKRSIALGRSKFRPGKRSLAPMYLTADDMERMGISPNAFSLLTEAQMGKRSIFMDPFSYGSSDGDMPREDISGWEKRSMAVGRTGFRPGKRSIATGRVGFRPGKRSAPLAEIIEIPAIVQE